MKLCCYTLSLWLTFLVCGTLVLGVYDHDGTPHGHTCVHDQFHREVHSSISNAEVEARKRGSVHLNAPATKKLRDEQMHEGRALLQTTGPAPLRMHAEYQLASANALFAQALQTEVMPRAMNALKRSLMVRLPVPGNFKIPRGCASSWQSNGKCAQATSVCFNLLPEEVPEVLFADQEICSSPSNCDTVPGGEGVDEADFVVFVTSQASNSCGPSTGAHAVACETDELNWYGLQNRPLVGYINFCPRTDDIEQDQKQMEALVDTAVHELIHTLFMSGSLFDQYVNADGSPAGSPVSNNAVTSRSVVLALQQHLECDTATAAPLEDDGGTSTAGSHWEASVFQSEIMVGASAGTERQVLSNLTLGLAQDSGWYTPSFAGAGFLRYGHKAGCSMLEGCTNVDPESRAVNYFCTEELPSTCLNQDTTAWCQQTPLYDCPLLQRYTNGDCKIKENVLTQFSNDEVTNVGIHYGPSSICIGVPGGSLQRAGQARTYSVSVTCMATACQDDGLYLLIKEVTSDDWNSYLCPSGEFVELGVSQGYTPGTRFGPCPAFDEVCPYKGCPIAGDKMCSGQGNCYQGKCYCSVDTAGADCSQSLCGSDNDCADEQFCNGDGECQWGNAPPPPPPSTGGLGPLVTNDAAEDYEAMRAIRVGYLQSCVFFVDQDGNMAAGIQERAQPSAGTGEVSLYVPGEFDTTQGPILQEAPATDSGCTDSLTGATNMAFSLRASGGIPTSGSSLNLLSTIVYLKTRGNTTLTRNAAAQSVSSRFGTDVSFVHGSDWLSIAVDDSSGTDTRNQALDVGEVSIPTIVTAEQVSAIVAGSDIARRRAVADSFVLALDADDREPLDALQDATWLSSQLENLSGEDALANSDSNVVAIDTEASAAAADAIVLVNSQIASARGTTNGNTVDLLEEWAKIAHVGENAFVQRAIELNTGDIDIASYRNGTSSASLEAGKAGYNVDLSEATLLDNPSFFDEYTEKVKAWLDTQHGPFLGWVWLLVASVVLFSCCCCSCIMCSKRKSPTPVKRRSANRQADSRSRAAQYQQYQQPAYAQQPHQQPARREPAVVNFRNDPPPVEQIYY